MNNLCDNKSQLSQDILKEYFSEIKSKSKIICNAPFASLYFNKDGRVSPCCIYSPDISFGHYPDSSIKEILDSAERNKLQGCIKNNNLDLGCTMCRESILSHDYEGAISTQYKAFNKNKKYPQRLDFELSHFCNLDCIMCGTHSKQLEPDFYQSETFLNELKPYIKHASECGFFGGEPFYIQTYYKIWDLIKFQNKKCHIYIQTNATLYNDRVHEVLKNTNIALGVSLDSISENTYNIIRKGADFKKVISNIEIFNKLMIQKEKSLNVSVCPMPINMFEIPQIFDYCNSLHSTIFFNTLSFPRNLSLSRLNSNDLLDYYNYLGNIKHKTYGNDSFEANLRKFESFRQLILSYSIRNKKYESVYLPENLGTVIRRVEKIIDNNELAQLFSEIYSDLNKDIIISPVILGDIFSVNDDIIKNTLTNYLRTGDFATIKKILGINE